MNDNLRQYKNRIIVTSVLLIFMFFIGFTNTGRTTITFTERIIGDFLSPVFSAASKSVNYVSDKVEVFTSIPSMISENKYLKTENMKLQEENLKLSDIISRSNYLKNEYDLLNKSSYSLVKASISGKSQEKNGRYLIDKGSLSGIKKDDTVVTGIKSSENTIVEGLVGKVVEVGDNYSKISLILDDDIGVSFNNVRTQEGGILNNSENSTIKGYTFNSNSDIVQDDRLYTSGLGEVYMPKIYIGRVSNVVTDEENMRKNITVVPAVDFEKLSDVLIIVGENNEENN